MQFPHIHGLKEPENILEFAKAGFPFSNEVLGILSANQIKAVEGMPIIKNYIDQLTNTDRILELVNAEATVPDQILKKLKAAQIKSVF